MESPVVVDKPPEYHGRPTNDRGFPFDEEDGSGAWSELESRHPDIAARLRQRPATWARKRRPNSQDPDDFGDDFGGFNRFPFDDIPPEFRDHFPSNWNRRQREQQPNSPPQPQTSPQPQQQTTATQTECPQQEQPIPQYGLRNTVDLGQKSPADPSLVNAEDRSHRSMSAPPDTNVNMSAQNHDQPRAEQQPSNVRVIPIVVEGRDEPVINKNVDHATHFGESKPAYVPPPQPHIDREQYFADEGPVGYVPPPNFSRSFGSPYGKFRHGPQPFVHPKVYPQSATAFARGASPQRSQSPKPAQEEQYVKVPVHHENAAPRPEQRQQARPAPTQHQAPPQQHQPPPQQHQPPPQQRPQQQQQAPPQPKPQPPSANDPITQILAIQTDVLNLMSDVENFKGTKKDKHYIYLDEMLTRNLIKLDNIETEGKENIRQARREAIKCIEKCIAVLEAKASEENKSNTAQESTQEVEMKEEEKSSQGTTDNGEVVMQEPKHTETQAEPMKPEENKEIPSNVESVPSTATQETQQVDTRPEGNAETEKKSPKKGKAKKRDKSKDKKEEKVDTETMQVDDKGDKQEIMEVESTSQ